MLASAKREFYRYRYRYHYRELAVKLPILIRTAAATRDLSRTTSGQQLTSHLLATGQTTGLSGLRDFADRIGVS